MAELIQNLGIDWKVLLAQVINFALLLYLLRRFAYEPVLKALNSRREKIESAIERSRQVDEKMERIENLKQEVLDEARRESENIIKKAEESAARVQEDILSKTHEKSERLMQEAEKKIRMEREKILNEVKEEIAGLVSLSIEKTMGDALNEHARQQLVDHTVKTIQATQRS